MPYAREAKGRVAPHPGPPPSLLSNPLAKKTQNAIERAVSYARETKDALPEGLPLQAVQLDKALANVGALLAQRVEGRVSTEVDARVADDAVGIAARGRHLVKVCACACVCACIFACARGHLHVQAAPRAGSAPWTCLHVRSRNRRRERTETRFEGCVQACAGVLVC